MILMILVSVVIAKAVENCIARVIKTRKIHKRAVVGIYVQYSHCHYR